MAREKQDPRVDKRRVEMKNLVAREVDGKHVVEEFVATDYIRPDLLDAYVADARTRWQQVTVSDEPDAGPGGYDGATHVPESLNHPLAGQTFPANKGGGGGKGSSFLPMFLGLMVSLAVIMTTMRLAIQTATMKSTLSDAYKAAALYGAIYTTVPSTTAGTEPSGGSPAYARKSLSWGSSTAGVVSTTATVFDVPTGSNIQGAGIHSAVTAGTYLDGASVTAQSFSSQGTYTVTFTYTQT